MKIIRLLAVILTVLTLIFTFSGCAAEAVICAYQKTLELGK